MMFRRKKKRSKDFAKDRLRTVLLSERIDCSSQVMLMMKQDLIQAFGKYLPVDRDRVTLRYVTGEGMIEAQFPLGDCSMEGENKP